MHRGVRSLVALLGALASLACAVLLLRAPGLAMEQIVLLSPIIAAIWLIVVLPSSRSRRRAARLRATPEERAAAIRRAVLTRDAGACRVCGARTADTVVMRPPAPAADALPLARFITVCDGCAPTLALPIIAGDVSRASGAGAARRSTIA